MPAASKMSTFRSLYSSLVLTAAVLAAPVFAAAPAVAEEAPGGTLHYELNKLEARDAGCRAYLVVRNETPEAFTALNLDLVMFDTEGIIARRLAVETAPLPSDRTTVKVFDMEGLRCDDIGRVLLNGVIACETEAGPKDGCLAMIETASRSDAEFME